ncbi:tRNA (adenosine(37)-N6)-threonylcarbamoyltransferase complex dimerization subunit type 1 TsaB [Thalassoroseus pseudoceratinae]|uniref:tRNA (adenosine(37)-N6)-threonylcarbamoyltransferase complex dimerization subunit type 1 TsaB n=1 Tax=Thalassoroseus pseudoceratinae TaxID=2713176 RepID=UPI0014208BA5|nr:tRNA (adenosine(37)-N6)-threonylcarbamoyltransferase complex dimerization subunit type 1 TsaB [Thalassoroseus pseudoceratinae]
MWTLGIETSGRAGSVALLRESELVGERILDRTGRRHAQTLLAEIDGLLRDNELAATDIHTIAVSAGPGSFTGLRVGIVCAKTFAFATGCHLSAVNTFQAVAENSPEDVAELFVIADAQRQDVFVGHFRRTEGSFVSQGDIEIQPAAEWCADRNQSDVLSGPGVRKWSEQLDPICQVLPESHFDPQARVVAALGAKRTAAGEFDDPWSLEPLYLRRSSAEDRWLARSKT